MTRAGKEKVGRRMARTSMCDLPPELVRMIFFKIPITSLRAVRSTCKLWESLTKDWILGKAAATRGQFLGFMTMDSKVFSVRFHLCHSKDKDLVTACIMQVDLLNQFEILKVFHCDGVLLCVAKDLERRLMVWNPYLGQTKWIRPLTDFNRFDHYALGYDTSGNHKILRYLYNSEESGFEIYDFNSNSWRLLEVTPDWNIGCGVSVKGNVYFYAIEHWSKVKLDENGRVLDIEDFLIAFDFTTETFGPRLPLPFHSCVVNEHVSLSCVRDEKLAVLYFNQGDSERFPCVEFWVTTTIEPKSVTWSKFLKVNDLPLAVYGFRFKDASFFIDEEEKVAVVFDLYEDKEDKTCYYTVFISGQDGYSKDGILGVALKVMEPCPVGPYCLPVVRYSSYLPSLVQLN